MTFDYIQRAERYMAAVLSGEIPACVWVLGAVRRTKEDFAKIGQDGWPFVFDHEKASAVCEFVERLRHCQGPLTGQRIYLEDWQAFVLTQIFGWVWRHNGKRRFKRVYIEVPRGNGKSLICSAVSLFLAFVEGEPGADVVTSASSEMQSRIVLDTARHMVEQNDAMREKLGLRVEVNRILQPKSMSRVRCLPSKASSLEGISVAGAIVDELHVHRDRRVYDSLSTACGKREQSILFVITTAGFDSSGVAAELHDFSERLLENECADESSFAIIYTTDFNDDWRSESTMRKANPNWKISVNAQSVMEEAIRAEQMPSQRASFRTKYLNEWLSGDAGDRFLDANAVRAALDKTLTDEQFRGQPAVMGCDLASKLDLCSLVRVHQKAINGKPHYYVFCKNWLPEDTLKNSPVSALRGWVEQGHLLITPGSITDHDEIERTIMDEWERADVRDFNYDPFQAAMLTTHLKNKTQQHDKFVEISQFAKNMTDGMNMLQELVADGRLHTNSPVLLWCMNNMQCKLTGLHFMFPVRPKDRNQKIDAAVALILALKSIAGCPLNESKNENPYLRRGILFI